MPYITPKGLAILFTVAGVTLLVSVALLSEEDPPITQTYPHVRDFTATQDTQTNSEDSRIVISSSSSSISSTSQPPSVAGKKVISFGLYGNKPKYTKGAIRNVQLAQQLFPEWTTRFYIDDTVPHDILVELLDLGAEIKTDIKDIHGDIAGMFWRFLVATDPEVEVYIIRDTDSRLSKRERAAIDEWLESNKSFHVMRDHPSHSSYAMSGGMWGGRKLIPNMLQLINDFNDKKNYVADMNFLNQFIWPNIKEDTFQHDSFSCVKYGAVGFPTRRNGSEHVGQVFDENDVPRKSDINILVKQLPEPKACARTG